MPGVDPSGGGEGGGDEPERISDAARGMAADAAFRRGRLEDAEEHLLAGARRCAYRILPKAS